jgi:hypothetical protein
MDTFFKMQNNQDRALDQVKKIPLMVRIFWRGTWERWHAQFNTAGDNVAFADRISDKSSIARRRGRNCKWDVCDCNAANNSGIPSKVYDYISIT